MTKIITIEYKKIFWTTVTLLVFSISLYLFFIASSVFNTVALRDAEIKSSELRSDLATLESKYVKIEKEIDRDKAQSLGFYDTKENLFSYAGLSRSVSSRE